MGIAPLAIGCVVGASLFWTMGRGFSSIATVGDPLADDALFRTSVAAYFVLLGISAAIVAAGLFAALEEFWARLAVGIGVGLLAAGLCWNGSQRITLHPDRFVVGGLLTSGNEYRYQRGDQVTLEIEPRPGSRFGNRHSVHLHRADGTDLELCHDTRLAPVWTFATPHLIRASRRAAAGP